jgi:hypothetical protein
MIRQVPDNHPESDEHGAQRLEHRPVGLGLGTQYMYRNQKKKKTKGKNI